MVLGISGASKYVGKFVLICFVNGYGEEERDVHFISDGEGLVEFVEGLKDIEGIDKETIEVMSVKEAYNSGVGFPGEDMYDEDSDEFRE